MKRTLHVINQNEDIVSLIDSSLHALFGSETCPTFSADQAAPQVCKKELATPQVRKKELAAPQVCKKCSVALQFLFTLIYTYR